MSIKFIPGPKVTDIIQPMLDRQKIAFVEAVSDAKTELVARTASGKDVAGKTFAKYTDKYAAIRKDKGRKISPPDLIFTGEMLSSIRVVSTLRFGDATGNLTKATIFFNDRKNEQKASGNMEKRDFFGLSEKQLDNIAKRVKAA